MQTCIFKTKLLNNEEIVREIDVTRGLNKVYNKLGSRLANTC